MNTDRPSQGFLYEQALTRGTALLDEAHVPNSAFDSESLLAYVLGLSRFDVLLNKKQVMSPNEYKTYMSLVLKRASRIPLQHLTKIQYFMGHPFMVSPKALIPRGETELLCEQVILYVNSLQKKDITILDLCTGSGALAVSLALALPYAKISACDISEEALGVAKQNTLLLKAEVAFYQGDFLAAVQGQTFDVIVTNPPYIPTEYLATLQEEVRREPSLALDGGEDGLVFYRRLAQEGEGFLTPLGRIFCEIGYDQGISVPALFKRQSFKTSLLKDLNQQDRMVIAYK